MAWTPATENSVKHYKETGATLGSAAGIDHPLSEIDFIPFNQTKDKRETSVMVSCSSVAGASITFEVFGAYETGGTKYKLVDTGVAAVNGDLDKAFTFDANAYPAAYYYVSTRIDADESANTISAYVTPVTG